MQRISYEKKIPTTVEEAMAELDRRIMIEAGNNFGQVNARVIFMELLKDFEQGLLAGKKNMIIIPGRG
ncbi:MAG: hypothetical protein N3A54_01220 [Patescibacteria group bacterium]|nr:hypothetical protein [Patescibacteria group bacterium]